MNILKKFFGKTSVGYVTTRQTPPPSLVTTYKPERSGLPVIIKPKPIIIPAQQPEPAKSPIEQLADWILIGAKLHPLCRNAFVEKIVIGYYAYNQRNEWRTCTLAAAYAGAFGPQFVEQPDFSYSMAVWRLSHQLNFNIGTFIVSGPTGRQQNLADEMIALTDKDLWTREGVAEWIRTLSNRR